MVRIVDRVSCHHIVLLSETNSMADFGGHLGNSLVYAIHPSSCVDARAQNRTKKSLRGVLAKECGKGKMGAWKMMWRRQTKGRPQEYEPALPAKRPKRK